MTLGPLEYVVVGFSDMNIDGTVAEEIAKVVENGTIRIVDLVFVMRDEAGSAVVAELDGKDNPAFASFAPLLGTSMALFTPEDLESIAADLPEGAAALVVLFEHHWAVDLKDAMAAKGGFLITRSVIPPEVLEEVTAELEAAGTLPA